MQVVELRREQAAEDSSGLDKTLPPGGNAPELVYHPGAAFLDSSLRWNDNEGIDAFR